MNEPDPAKARWALLQTIRLGAALVVLLGIAIVSGAVFDAPTLGYVLLVTGAAAFFALPAILARRWKSGR